VSQSNNYVETVVREVKKIGRNEKVTIKNVSNGETKTIKFKVAESLIKKGDWIIFNDWITHEHSSNRAILSI